MESLDNKLQFYQQADIKNQIDFKTELIKNELEMIKKTLDHKELLLVNRLNRIDFVMNTVKKYELEIDDIFSKLDLKDHKELFNTRWEVLTERISYLQNISNHYLLNSLYDYEVTMITNKLQIYIEYYQEVLNNYNEKIPDKRDDYRINISHFQSDYTSIKNINVEKYDNDSLKKLLVSLQEINSELKKAINDEKTIMLYIGQEVASSTTNEYDLTIQIDANKSKNYIGKLDVKLRVIKKIRKLIQLGTDTLSALALDQNNNWYAASERTGNVYLGKGNNLIKTFNNFDNSKTISALAIDRQNNWYAITFEGGLYFGKSQEEPKKVSKLSLQQNVQAKNKVRSLIVDHANNWYAGTNRGMIYYGKSQRTGRWLQTIKLGRDNIVSSLGVDLNNNWYAAINNGFLVSGLTAKEGKKIDFIKDPYDDAHICFALNYDGSYWHALTRDGKLYYGATGKEGKLITTLPKDEYGAIKIDRKGNWYGTAYNGKIYYGKAGVKGSIIADLGTDAWINLINFDNDDNLYVSVLNRKTFKTDIYIM